MLKKEKNNFFTKKIKKAYNKKWFVKTISTSNRIRDAASRRNFE